MRGNDLGKHEKTGKARENVSRKPLVGNTIEQYARLKLAAASRFSEENIKKSGKAENRHFSGNEQYAGLESQQAGIPPVQAARSRESSRLEPAGSRGYQGCQKG